jgi:DNA-binding MarR family transcriptional regulator
VAEIEGAGDQTAALVRGGAAVLMRFLHHGLRGHLPTLQQFRILGALIDGQLGTRPPTVTGLVGPLERESLITRRRDPITWRTVLSDLRHAGREVYHSIMAAARWRQALIALSEAL